MGVGPPAHGENELSLPLVVDPGDVGCFLVARGRSEFGAGASGTPHWGPEPAEQTPDEEAPPGGWRQPRRGAPWVDYFDRRHAERVTRGAVALAQRHGCRVTLERV